MNSLETNNFKEKMKVRFLEEPFLFVTNCCLAVLVIAMLFFDLFYLGKMIIRDL